MQQGEGIPVCLQLGKWAVHLLSCVGCLDPEQGEESHFVGRRRGHVCIQEALNLEPLDLRLSPQGPGPYYPFILLILQPDLLVQEYSLPSQALLCPGPSLAATHSASSCDS